MSCSKSGSLHDCCFTSFFLLDHQCTYSPKPAMSQELRQILARHAAMMSTSSLSHQSRRKRMPCPQRLSAWQREVSSAFAHLSRTQANGLALWSAGIALTGSGGITQISVLLAQVLAQKEGTVFQRL